MLDMLMSGSSKHSVFEIKYRKYVFILEFSVLIRNFCQCLIPTVLQKPIIYFVNITGDIHPVEFLPDLFYLIFRKIPVIQCLVFIHQIFHHRIHSCKDRNILKFEIEQMDQLLFGFFQSTDLNRLKIHQLIFQNCQKAFHLSDKSGRLLLQIALPDSHLRKMDQLLQIIITVLTVRYDSFQFSVRKQIKTHLLDIFFSKLWQNVGNIIRKYAVR